MKLQRLQYEKDFLDILDNMLGENITKILLSLKNKPYFMEFNDIDVVLNSDSLRYTNSKGTKTRIKIGRLINKIFEATGVSKSIYNASDVERFVYLFKAFSNFDELAKDFKVVQGEDIKKWYNEKNYDNGGSLGNSCMKYSECQSFFNLYIKNPKRIKMLILTDPTGKKLLGRAILWKNVYFRLDGEEKDERERVTFMDRIYSSDDSTVDLFKIYAAKNGWVYKTKQALDVTSYIKDGKRVENPKLCFYLEEFQFKSYPYMDSMISFSPINGFISNKKFKNSHYLNNTGGNTHIANVILKEKAKA